MSHALALVLLAAGVLGCNAGSDAPAELAATQPAGPAGLEPGWELVPQAKYSASQTPGEVIIKAWGENPATNYENKLFQSPLRIWPPQYVLGRRKIGDFGGATMTPFNVTASFKAADRVQSVRVHDGAGAHDVPVDQARD